MNRILIISALTLFSYAWSPLANGQESADPVFFTLSGQVLDVSTKKPIKNALVRLIPRGGISSETKTDRHGIYRFEEIEGSQDAYILPNSEYTVIIIKKGYDKAEDELSTVGVEESQDFELDFYLKKNKK